MYVYVYVSICLCMFVYLCIPVYASVCQCLSMYASFLCLSKSMYAYVCLCVMYVCVSMYVSVCLCMPVLVCAYARLSIMEIDTSKGLHQTSSNNRSVRPLVNIPSSTRPVSQTGLQEFFHRSFMSGRSFHSVRISLTAMMDWMRLSQAARSCPKNLPQNDFSIYIIATRHE